MKRGPRASKAVFTIDDVSTSELYHNLTMNEGTLCLANVIPKLLPPDSFFIENLPERSSGFAMIKG